LKGAENALEPKHKRIAEIILAGTIALFGTYGLGKKNGYTEGRNESYTMWLEEGHNQNHAYGSWKFMADCAQYFNDTGVEWDKKTTVPGPMVKKDEGIDQLTIYLPNTEQVNQAEPKPTEQMKERAKRLQEALCNENDGEAPKDRGGYYDGTAYIFTLSGNKVRYQTHGGKARGFYILPSTNSNREITIITPQRKSEKGTEQTAEALAGFFFPDNKGVEREN
jgi:hypothetical protein